MKILKLSMVAALTIGGCTIASADSLAQTLKDGKVSGEFTATYETRNFDKENGAYYQDTGYSVGSFALKYETGVWNNLSLTSKFRAYTTLFEDDSNSTTSHGRGDASERFYQDGKNRDVDAEELFVTYTPNSNITVKAGRQFISTDWINKTQDAVRIDAKYGNTAIEAIWSARQGRIYSRDYRPMSDINGNKGVYKLGLTQTFTENISATAYGLMVPDVRDIYGGKTNFKFNDTALRAHYAVSSDDKDSTLDSTLIDVKVSTKIAGFAPYAGYIKVDDDAAFPGYGASNSGEIIVPFEEGDYVYSKGAETYYLGVSKSFGDLSSTLLYGNTEYISGSDKLELNETTLWLGYALTSDLKANLGYTLVDEDEKSATSDYDQLNATLTYSF